MVTRMYLVLLFIVISGCSMFGGSKASTTSNLNKFNINPSLLSWNEKQKVKLLPHQLIPINYLENNPNIKGLLIFHYLGTGKTFLALGFAERNLNKDIVILCPRFLRAHWLSNIDKYGVTDKSRYKIISIENPVELQNKNLRNTVVIIDESHKLIDKLFNSPLSDQSLTKIYTNIQKSYKTLSLTGTPIYNSIVDFAFQLNLTSGKDLLSYNKFRSRQEITQINGLTSAFRGHISESLALPILLSGTSYGLALSQKSPNKSIAAVGTMAGLFGPLLINYNINASILRSFDLDKIRPFVKKYISYYDFRDEKNRQHYPTVKKQFIETSLNTPQVKWLLDFANSDLNDFLLQILVQDEQGLGNIDSEFLKLNSYKIQEEMKRKPNAAQQIGNMPFINSITNKKVYPNKFEKIYAKLKNAVGPSVIYSHFYNGGILYFANYLDSIGLKSKYKILTPYLSIEETKNMVEDYNSGKIKILLLHPEIMEGISLKATEQLHILEVPFNKAIEEQVSGRVVRYKSHAHLPKNRQKVNIYIWMQPFEEYSWDYITQVRRSWYKSFGELNYYSQNGYGRIQVDPNYMYKTNSPDQRALQNNINASKDMDKLTNLLKIQSIEVAK